MRPRTKVTWAVLACAGLLVGAQARASDTQADDAQLKARVEARLANVAVHQPAKIEVTVRDGRLFLEGQVPTVADRWKIEKAARSVTRHLESRVAVEPRTELSDQELQEQITKAVLGYAYYGVFDAVGFQVQDGVVHLTGSVYRPYHKSDIEQRIALLSGVRELTSDISVQPLSPYDEALRRECYRAIYGNTVFSRMAFFPNPPVRILVSRGRVTLAGVVTKTADRDLLTILASEVPSFGPIKNEVRIEKDKPKQSQPERTEPEVLTTV
jgi:osmotically-inducible protein OsmY